MTRTSPVSLVRLRPLAIAVAVALLALVTAGCGGSGSTQSSGSASHAYTMAMPSVPSTLDNEFVIHPMVIDYQPLVYDTLLQYGTIKSRHGAYREADIFGPTIKGALAESYTVDAAKTTYTFKLRANAKSFYGNTLSPEDVIWAFERKLALKGNSALNMDRMGISSPSQITKVDAHTVRIKTDRYRPLFLAIMTEFFGNSIWDSTEVKKHTTAQDPWAKAWLSRNDAGYGPYHVTSYQPGSEMRLGLNPGYWGAKPFFTSIVWKEVPSAANRLALLKNHSVDYAFGLTPKARSSLADDKAVNVYSNPSNLFTEIGFNNTIKPFDNRDFRLALAYAFPYEQVMSSVYFGEARLRKSVVPEVFPGYDGKYWAAKTDLAKAKQLLAASGVPKSTRVTITIDATSNEAEQIALLAKTAFAQLGLQTDVDKQAPATFSDRLGKRQLATYVYSDQPIYPDVGFATWLYFHRQNFPAWTNYRNPQVERLFTTADAKKDPKARMADYDTVQKLIMQDMPVIPVAQPGQHETFVPGIEGYAWYPDNAVRVQYLSRAAG